LIRAKRQFYRKSLSFSSDYEILVDHINDKPGYFDYGYSYWQKRLVKLSDETKKSGLEMIENANTFLNTYSDILNQENELSQKLMNNEIRFTAIFKKFEEGNINKITETRDQTQKAIKEL